MSVELSKHEYEKLQREVAKLRALEAGGVDNWEWYDESLKEWRKENEVEELVDDFIENLSDILVEADVEEPAGRGCGYAIHFDTDSIKAILETSFRKYMEIMNEK